MKTIFKAFTISLLVLVIFLIAIPQANILHSFVSSILVLLWIFTIIVIGIPSWRESIEIYFKFLNPVSIPIIFVIFPYIMLLISGATQLTSFVELFLWYLLPTTLFLLPEAIKDRFDTESYNSFRILLNIIAAAIIWIGFDHRYTKVLFEGFIDLGYTLNSIWMASIVMVTFGLSVGIQNIENEKDIGITPSLYASKVANITTPVASLIVIPFGLITGFLIWNPQEFNILVIFISFIGIFLTIALQEELIFRGILQNELTKLKSVKSNQLLELLVIILVTITFALTHWNNEVEAYVYHYFIAAFVAGLAYAISYKKAGLFAAILSHTLVDWIWALLLKRV